MTFRSGSVNKNRMPLRSGSVNKDRISLRSGSVNNKGGYINNNINRIWGTVIGKGSKNLFNRNLSTR